MTEPKPSPLNYCPPKTKTYGREVACVLLVFVMYLAYLGKDSTLEVLVWPTYTFAIAAFGIKTEAIKEIVDARKPK